MAMECSVRDCACAACQAGDHPEREDHRYLNLILSRLDEQQRRWVAGREARRRGHGGIQQVAEITGLHPETIRIGRDELEQDLEGRAYLAVTVDDDPGKDLGMLRQPGHRFFFSPAEVEPLL